ncbi:sensor histidine kinase [Sanguibacter sp. A247]|uniref:sensor histidine kinase n=1 Tax=unclassified Sanguibacter TaxID=2645534 RepID=UPI003FD790AA
MRLSSSVRRLASKPPVPAPPLTAWGRTWRFTAVLLCSFVLFGSVLPEPPGSPDIAVSSVAEATAREALDVALGLASYIIVWFRRRWPMTVVVVLLVMSSLSVSASAAATLAVVSVCARRRMIEVVPVTALLIITSLASYYTVDGLPHMRWWGVVIVQLMSTILIVGVGLYIGARRELVWTLQSRAEAAERARATDAERARAQERAAIAHEMHDVLAHRVSLVAMHAGALAYRTDLSPEEVRESAGVVRDNAHRALEELREVLGVLRAGTDLSATDAPQPTLERIDDLVADARALGARVDFGMTPSVTDESATLAGSTVRTAYRIVQEGLTNARKHAAASPIVVRVTGTPDDGLTVMVRTLGRRGPGGGTHRGALLATPAGSVGADVGVARVGGSAGPSSGGASAGSSPGGSSSGGAMALPASGHGLRGLRERVALLGGTFDAGDDATGGFVVRASLPWSR